MPTRLMVLPMTLPSTIDDSATPDGAAAPGVAHVLDDVVVERERADLGLRRHAHAAGAAFADQVLLDDKGRLRRLDADPESEHPAHAVVDDVGVRPQLGHEAFHQADAAGGLRAFAAAEAGDLVVFKAQVGHAADHAAGRPRRRRWCSRGRPRRRGPQASRSNFVAGDVAVVRLDCADPVSSDAGLERVDGVQHDAGDRRVHARAPSSATPRLPTSLFPWIRRPRGRSSAGPPLAPGRPAFRWRSVRTTGCRRSSSPLWVPSIATPNPPRAGARQHEGGGPLQSRPGRRCAAGRLPAPLAALAESVLMSTAEVGDFDLVGADHPNRAADAAIDEDAGGTVAPQADGAAGPR